MPARRKKRSAWGYIVAIAKAAKVGLIEGWIHRNSPDPGAEGTIAFVKALYKNLGVKDNAGE